MPRKTTAQIECDIQEMKAKASKIRAEIEDLSDADLVSFADWLANNELSTITEFIEAKAYDQSREPETF